MSLWVPLWCEGCALGFHAPPLCGVGVAGFIESASPLVMWGLWVSLGPPLPLWCGVIRSPLHHGVEVVEFVGFSLPPLLEVVRFVGPLHLLFVVEVVEFIRFYLLPIEVEVAEFIGFPSPFPCCVDVVHWVPSPSDSVVKVGGSLEPPPPVLWGWWVLFESPPPHVMRT